MALVNYSLPFGPPMPTSWATISPIHASPHAVNNLYEPTGHHQENVLHNDDYYKNGPYRQQLQQPQKQMQQQNSRNYLPPHQQSSNINVRNAYDSTRTRTYGESSYSSNFNNRQNTGYYNNGQSFKENSYQKQPQQVQPQLQTTKAPNARTTAAFQSNSNNFNQNQAAGYPAEPPGFKPIQAGQGSRTQNGELRLFIGTSETL